MNHQHDMAPPLPTIEEQLLTNRSLETSLGFERDGAIVCTNQKASSLCMEKAFTPPRLLQVLQS